MLQVGETEEVEVEEEEDEEEEEGGGGGGGGRLLRIYLQHGLLS
jgi:hypothetical protein